MAPGQRTSHITCRYGCPLLNEKTDHALLLMGQLVAEGRMDGGSDPLHMLFLPPGPLGSGEPWTSLFPGRGSKGIGPSWVGCCPPSAWCTDRERQMWTWPQLVLTCLRKTKVIQAVFCLPGSLDTAGSLLLTEAPKTRTSDWLSLAWRI